MEKSTNVKRDVYQIVTDKIIELLEQGTIPWKQPWTKAGMPMNLVTKKSYRGINVFLLASLNYSLNLFITKNQLTNLDGEVKEKEKPHMVVFWKWPEGNATDITEGEIEIRKPPLLRYYLVYNIAQCSGIPDKMIPSVQVSTNNPLQTCESIIENMPLKPEIQINGHQAYYHPVHDYINMPEQNAFIDSEHYYSVLFHELIHSTGHHSRLSRKEIIKKTHFGSVPYSIEELTAEIGACYLNSLTGNVSLHRPLENNVAYIQGWLKKLKNDRKFIVYGSAQAQRAVDFILKSPVKEREPENAIEKFVEIDQ